MRQHKTKKNNRDQRDEKIDMFIWDAVLDLNMGKTQPDTGKPDFGIPRIPGRHFGLGMANAPECDMGCGQKTTTDFMLGGHGGNPCCPPCFADLWNIRHMTDDDYTNFLEIQIHDGDDAADKLAHELGLEKHGVNHTLDCGCVLTDLSNGEKYIMPCHIHMATTDLKIVLTKDDLPCETTNELYCDDDCCDGGA